MLTTKTRTSMLRHLFLFLATGALSSTAAAQATNEKKYFMIQTEGGCISRRAPDNDVNDELFLDACNPQNEKLLWRFDHTSTAITGDTAGQFRSAMDDSECIQVGERWEINQGPEALQRGTSLYTKRCSIPNRNEFNIAKEAFQAFPIAWSIYEGPLTLDARPDLCVVHFGVNAKVGESRIMLLECDSLSGTTGRALGWNIVPVNINVNTVVEIPCTQEIFLCPDGSVARRVAPLCHFAACPSGSGAEEHPPTFFNEQEHAQPQEEEPLIEVEEDEDTADDRNENESSTNGDYIDIDTSKVATVLDLNTTAQATDTVAFAPTVEPTVAPPTAAPTWMPSTAVPTIKPTRRWTRRPTPEPTAKPTRRPTKAPTNKPTRRPSREPTREPTDNFAWDAPQFDSEQENEEVMPEDNEEKEEEEKEEEDDGLSFACRHLGLFCGETGLEVRSEEDISPTTLSPTVSPTPAPTSEPSQEALICLLTTLC